MDLSIFSCIFSSTSLDDLCLLLKKRHMLTYILILHKKIVEGWFPLPVLISESCCTMCQFSLLSIPHKDSRPNILHEIQSTNCSVLMHIHSAWNNLPVILLIMALSDYTIHEWQCAVLKDEDLNEHNYEAINGS